MEKQLSDIDARILKNKAAIKKLQEERRKKQAQIKARTASDNRKKANRMKIIVGALLTKHYPAKAIELLEKHGSDADREFVKYLQFYIEQTAAADEKSAADLLKGALG